MFEIMTLNLGSPMSYGIKDASFNDVLSSIYEKENGFEALFRYKIIYSDECIGLEKEEAAFGHLLKGAEEAEDIMMLNSGRYIFSQLPIPDDENELQRLFLPLAYKSSCSTLYIRLIKENELEAVMQFMLPC